MNITDEQLAKIISITTCFIMHQYNDTLTKDELIDIKQSATNDIQRQLENKEGVYDIDAMYENVLSKLKTK